MIYYKHISKSQGVAVFQDLLSSLFSLITDVRIYSIRRKVLARVLHTLRKQERTFQGCLVASEYAIFVFAAVVPARRRLGGHVHSARALNLFDNLARVLFCLVGDVRVMQSSLMDATDGHSDTSHNEYERGNDAPCGLRRRDWVLT